MNSLFLLILIAIAGAAVLDLTGHLLNLRHASPELPEPFRDTWDSHRYRQSQLYLRDQTRWDMFSTVITTSLTLAFLIGGGFNALDLWIRGFGFHPIFTGIGFVGTLGLLAFLIRLPFSIADTFVIEARYGFNRTTWKTFVLDGLKTVMLSLVIGAPLLALIFWFFQWAGPGAWLYAWVSLSLFQLLIGFIAPIFILPLFNKFTPMPEGPLRNAIETYAREQKLALQGVFTMDGSRRSSKANAFFTGFGRYRRIVLFDTLVSKYSTAELVAVLAHEVGHYRLHHVPFMLSWSIALNGLMLAILGYIVSTPSFTLALGMQHHSIHAALVLGGFLLIPLTDAAGILGHGLSRRYEYAADTFAVRTCGNSPDALISALKKLTADSLSNLTPHPLKVILSYSHPPILLRLKALNRLNPHREKTC